MESARKIIDEAWESRTNINPSSALKPLREAVEYVIAGLDAGRLRVCDKDGGTWVTHQWIKKAVLLSFRLEDNHLMEGGASRYFDKVPSKFTSYNEIGRAHV